jgi:hypothetical protein
LWHFLSPCWRFYHETLYLDAIIFFGERHEKENDYPRGA